MKTLGIIIIVMFSIRVYGITYYVSNNGNDLQNGTAAATPWRSLEKLSEVLLLLKPGDSILFERGSVFVGELKISVSGKLNHDIHIGAYGSGVNPVIKGSSEIKNWTIFRDNIWVAECVECMEEPGNLFADGEYQPMGRYPNDDYMTLSCNSKCTTTLVDNHHTFADGYWDGSEAVVKSSRWTLDNLPVANYFNGTFYFSTPASYTLRNGQGYFIQKHLSTLDKPGEWFFEKNSKKIFFVSGLKDKPVNHLMEVSTAEVGLKLTKANFISIENLTFKYQRIAGIQIEGSDNVSLRNCQVDYSGTNGIEMIFCKNPSVVDCRIRNSNNNGIEWRDNTNGSFIRNSIVGTGRHAGRGQAGNGTYIGLRITGDNSLAGKNLFQYNSVDSTGYIGIDFRTGSTSIRNNLISNFCMIKDDGAGIYTWGNSRGDNTIEGNIVVGGVGCGAGTSDVDQVWVHGIYIDDRSSNIDVIDNTVAYCGTSGVFIHNAKQISIQGNTLFANGNGLLGKESGQLSIALDDLVPDMNKNLDLRVGKNKIATSDEQGHCVYIWIEKEQDLKELGLFNQNFYGAPDASHVVGKFSNRQNTCNATENIDLAEWQRYTHNDTGSQFIKVGDQVIESAGTNLVLNSRMTNNTEGWIAWPSHISITQDKRKGVDGPSLRVQFSSNGGEGLVYHAGISLSSKKIYRLSFVAKSTTKTNIEFAPLMASSPWEALDDYSCFSIDTVFKSFTYFFRPNRGSKDARANFKARANFWIDNVTLSEVPETAAGGQHALLLFYNATENPKTIWLPEKFMDLNGIQISDSLVLPKYTSIILRKFRSAESSRGRSSNVRR